MEIPLDLSRHCIETAARLRLEQLIRECLKSPDQEKEAWIEALAGFLETADFSDLRTRISRLAGTQRSKACLVFSSVDPNVTEIRFRDISIRT